MKKAEYAKYLRSAQWKALRQRAIGRAGGRCQLCNVGGPLQVHHRTYERVGRELLDDLTVLCAPCHRKHHVSVPARDRASRKREIDAEILEIVGAAGLVAWRDVQRQIKAPRAQAWSRCQKLLRGRKLSWEHGKLRLYVKIESKESA